VSLKKGGTREQTKRSNSLEKKKKGSASIFYTIIVKKDGKNSEKEFGRAYPNGAGKKRGSRHPSRNERHKEGDRERRVSDSRIK